MGKLPVTVGIAAAVVMILIGTNLPADISVTNGQVLTHISIPPAPKQTVAQKKLSPGVYQATPYSMIVIVPGPTDPHMALTSPNLPNCQIRVAKPNPEVEFKRLADPPAAQNYTPIPSVYSNLLYSVPNPQPHSTLK